MKMTPTALEFKREDVLDVAADVHKKILNLVARLPGMECEDACVNSTRQIEKQLQAFHQMAMEHGKKTLRIVCEPSGEYERKLLRTARRLGFLTAYVNTESVKKFRVIESNDTGKTDHKDPRVINSLAAQGKTIRHRILPPLYQALRKLGAMVEDEEITIVSLRGRIHRVLVELFCDYDFSKDFLYTASGAALVAKYGCNPYKIIRSGSGRFSGAMRRSVKRIRVLTLQRLWNTAECSVLNDMAPEYIEVLEEHLRQLYRDWQEHKARKERLEQQMIVILRQLRAEDPRIPAPTRGIISEPLLARLLAETGPLGDFDGERALLRYGGMNLRERQSGQYKGLTRISKKGRGRLRGVLGNIVLPLVKRAGLYGEFYQGKRVKDKMCGNKAMTAVMRSFLAKFYGWYRSGRAFDRERFFLSLSEYRKQHKAA